MGTMVSTFPLLRQPGRSGVPARLTHLSGGGGDDDFGCRAEIPDDAAGEDEADRDQLGSAQSAAEVGTTATGVIAQEFDQEARDAVEEEVSAKNLPVEFLAGEHPGEDAEVDEYSSGLAQLIRLERIVDRRVGVGIENRTGESEPPNVRRWLSVAAPGSETANARDGIADREAGRDSVTWRQRRHVVFTQEPPSYD